MEALEFYGRVNWLKGGIAFADGVTTVSPTYAEEIQTPAFGCGLDGFLRAHRAKLRGILNGIDTDLFDPTADPALPYHFSDAHLANKTRCKKALLKTIGMPWHERPLFIFIGRFVEQKGIDWLAEATDRLADFPITLAILGDGDGRFESAVMDAAKRHANLFVRLGYDEDFSRRLYAGADFLLMPSRFEPCGLNQMIAMRYGTVPIVRPVGGLRDTVQDYKVPHGCGKGIVFKQEGPEALVRAVAEAVKLYVRPRRMNEIKKADMRCDFSIGRCADAYKELYESLS
jgi:starch synthase